MSNQMGRFSGKPTGGRPAGLSAYSNGRLPLSKLRKVTTQPHLGNSDAAYLFGPYALAFDAMVRAATKDGVKIKLVVGYRDFETQVLMKKIWTQRGKPNNAAKPGTSSHGWGSAADIDMQPGVLEWLKKNCVKFGLDSPMWAMDGVGTEEKWHWQFQQDFTFAAEVPVYVDGKLVEDADAFMKDNLNWVAVRPVATALHALLGGYEDGKIFIDGPNSDGWIDFEIVDGVGYSPIGQLCELLGRVVQWDGSVLRVT